MKACSVCGERKSSAAFQMRRASRDGLSAACRNCLSERDKRRYRESAERREYCLSAAKRYPIAAREARKRYSERHPERRRAHIAVNNALRDGRLQRGSSCEVCGQPATEAHHHDYTRPLDVWWLCASCHSRLHQLMRR